MGRTRTANSTSTGRRRAALAVAVSLTAVVLAAACSASSTATTTPATGSPGGAAAPGTTAGTAPAASALPARYQGYRSETYAKPESWLCKPGLATDYCTSGDLDTTVVRADGTTEAVPHVVAKDPPVDCFYVYPTVNLAPGGGNKTDLTQIGPEVAVVKNQIARFSEACTVYAPLYRQMNLSAYSSADREQADALAYGDVLAAFTHYMANDNKGRPVVLVGHSQGSGHLAHLLKDEFDQDPAMQERLVSALLIGGFTQVPPGQDTGGTFSNLRLCRSSTQTACVVAFNSFGPDAGAGSAMFGATQDGLTGACTNPAALGGGSGVLVPDVADSTKVTGIAAVTTPFARFPDALRAECKQDATRSYLEIATVGAPGDPRGVAPLVANVPGWGLHLTEFNLTMGSLLDLVRSQSAAMR